MYRIGCFGGDPLLVVLSPGRGEGGFGLARSSQLLAWLADSRLGADPRPPNPGEIRRMASFVQRLLNKWKYGEPIVVVSGLPRSGTSMCMKMLEAGGVKPVQDGIRAADEDNPKGYFEHERVKELDKGGDKSWVKNARGHAIKVISFLLPHLPTDNRYQVVFLHRDYQEVLASQQKMLDRRAEKNETEDARMIEIYDKHLADVKRILARRDCFDVIYLHYTEVLQDPLSNAKRVAEFLGGDMDPQAMAAAVDPSLWRNRAKSEAGS